MDFIQPLNDHCTAIIFIRPLWKNNCTTFEFNAVYIRPLYGHYTAFIWPLYGLSGKIIVPPSSSMQSIYGHYTVFIRPLYGHYTAVISINLLCISKGMLEKIEDYSVCSHLN